MGGLLGEDGKEHKGMLEEAPGEILIVIFEELRTILIEIEVVLSNHPLMYVYDDENGVSYPLTPSKLVNERQLMMTVDG